MRSLRNGSVIVLPRGNNLVDVFTGTGWARHSVFNVSNGKIKLINGFGLSNDEFSLLLGTL